MSISLEERRARLQALLERYCVETRGRFDTMLAARDACARGDIQSLRILSLQAHTLVGSGATMGFPTLSEAAFALEEILSPLMKTLDQPDSLPPDLLESIDSLLVPLGDAVDAMKTDGLTEKLLHGMS